MVTRVAPGVSVSVAMIGTFSEPCASAFAAN